jgi:uncharacterized integral membrane protein
MRVLVWLFRAFLFFTLFAFALNNQHKVNVRWFFGMESSMPMVIVVLAAFAAGAVLGVVAMLPGWWRHRRVAPRAAPAEPVPAAVPPAQPAAPPAFGPDGPPRDGL